MLIISNLLESPSGDRPITCLQELDFATAVPLEDLLQALVSRPHPHLDFQALGVCTSWERGCYVDVSSEDSVSATKHDDARA